MSSPLNVIQMEANRRNAQQSTGPRTEIGKKTSSLNALRHGLTSRVVVLPSEDLVAYKKFSDEYLASLLPKGSPNANTPKPSSTRSGGSTAYVPSKKACWPSATRARKVKR